MARPPPYKITTSDMEGLQEVLRLAAIDGAKGLQLALLDRLQHQDTPLRHTDIKEIANSFLKENYNYSTPLPSNNK